MACDVAALPFQAHANYGAWSIDMDCALFLLRLFMFVLDFFYIVSYTVIALPNIAIAKVVAISL